MMAEKENGEVGGWRVVELIRINVGQEVKQKVRVGKREGGRLGGGSVCSEDVQKKQGERDGGRVKREAQGDEMVGIGGCV
jgi:hypothetical protein